MTRQEQNDYIIGLFNNDEFIEKNKELVKSIDNAYVKNYTGEDLADLTITCQDKLDILSDNEIKNIQIKFSLKKLYFDTRKVVA